MIYPLFTLPLMVLVCAQKSTVCEDQQGAVYPALAFSGSHNRITFTFIILKISSLPIMLFIPYVVIYTWQTLFDISILRLPWMGCATAVRAHTHTLGGVNIPGFLAKKRLATTTLMKATLHFNTSLHEACMTYLCPMNKLRPNPKRHIFSVNCVRVKT